MDVPTRSKTAALADRHLRHAPGSRLVEGFAGGQEVLRCPVLEQGGVGGDPSREGGAAAAAAGGEHPSVFFLDGEPHKRRRAAIARFFTPRAITTRHRAVMERATDDLLAGLQRRGGGRLDDVSFRLAVAVAAEIVGLTESDQRALGRHISGALTGAKVPGMRPVVRWLGAAAAAASAGLFYLRDVRPALRARRAERREDVISHLLDEGYPDRAILIECLTYGAAGMITTREFIVVAAWHLFEDDALRERFLNGDEPFQIAVLEEILRLEPVASVLHRKAAQDAELGSGAAREGDVLAVSIRAANLDETAVGACPHDIDPDRVRARGVGGAALSFGDGAHRCPGANVALQETRVFLDRLLRLPGIRLVGEPTIRWVDELGSYEVRGAVVGCDRS